MNCSRNGKDGLELTEIFYTVVRQKFDSMFSRKFFVGALIGACLFSGWPVPADFQGATHIMPFDEDTIAYSKTKSTGPVAKLQERIDKREVTLKRDEHFVFLLCILEQLKAR